MGPGERIDARQLIAPRLLLLGLLPRARANRLGQLLTTSRRVMYTRVESTWRDADDLPVLVVRWPLRLKSV